MTQKKLIIIVSSIIVILVLIVLAIFIVRKANINNNPNNSNNTTQSTPFKPDFLSSEEKQALKLNTDLRIQAVKRNPEGKVMVYKIIRSDSDITNPATVKPISPRER